MKNIVLFLFVASLATVLASCSSAPKLVPSTHWEQQSASEYKATTPIDPNPPEPAKEQTSSFCTYSGGLQFGREGGIYTGQCPKTLERAFKKGYLKGKTEYDLQQKEKGNK